MSDLWSIDENGLVYLNDQAILDSSTGSSLLQAIYKNDHNVFCLSADKPLEIFDRPYVVQKISFQGQHCTLHLPYELTIDFQLSTLTVDEWDRFHGFANNGIPFVFSSNAQEQFFDSVDEFDDESFTYAGVQYLTAPWRIQEATQPSSPLLAIPLYNKDHFLQYELDVIKIMLPRLKLVKQRILVVGQHPAASDLFAQEGHIVSTCLLADLLKHSHLVPSDYATADLVFVGHDFHSAPYDQRGRALQILQQKLSAKGSLMALLNAEQPQSAAPLFGCSEWEMRQYLKKYFIWNFWGRWRFENKNQYSPYVFLLGQKR
ncbi:MAG: hypothetical protein ACOYOK_08135 [Pseudobdellovibrionaceae bacterium]